MRDMSTEDKIRSLAQRSIEGINGNPIEQRIPIPIDRNGIPDGFPIDEIFGLMEYFQDKPVYVIELPICNVPHPQPRRRLVDPDLRNTPAHCTVSIEEGRVVNSFHELTEEFNRLIDEDKEIFIYIFGLSTVIYNPFDFTPERRVFIRYTTIDKSYWTTPIEGYVEPTIPRPAYMSQDGLRYQMGGQLQANPMTTNESFERLDDDDIVIKKSRNNLKFE